MGPNTNWLPYLDGIDAIVHLAARVHVMTDKTADPAAEFQRVNAQGTAALAEAAVAAGVGRFINLSSIKVNGDSNESPFTSVDIRLRILLCSGGNRANIVPHLHHLFPFMTSASGWSRVKGNFLKLINLISENWPLPLASVRNKKFYFFG